MFIRPYTLSQAAMLLLAGFLLVYLQVAVRRTPAAKDIHTRWMVQAIAWTWVLILLSLIIGVSEDRRIDFLAYARLGLGMFAWHAVARAIYALPPFEPFARRQEARFTSWAIAGFLSLEVCHFCLRLWRFSQTGLPQPLIWPMALPSLIASTWVLWLVMRKLWKSEDAPNLSHGQHLHRALFAPQSDVSRFYRGFLLAVFGMLLIGFLFIFMAVVIVTLPLWMLVAADLLVTTAILIALFAYLVSPLATTGLEIRVMGAGLTIFLGLISVLGWIVTLTFLNYQAPGIDPMQIFGTQMQTHFVTSALYRPQAKMLSELLSPLLWFAVGGSLIYLLLYTTYYRRTLQSSLGQIIGSFGQVQQGNLSHRIPGSTWEDEFSQIGVAFNQMAQTLEESSLEVSAYQTHLQELVDQRTQELGREIESRKNQELHRAIQEERARIARESHDGLLQTLMGVRIRLNRGKYLSQQASPRIEAEMSELAGEVTLAAQELRNLINDLNADILDNGLVTALGRIIARQQRSSAIDIQSHLAYEAGLLTPAQETNVLRIVQEALTNSCRHSNASEIRVTLQCETQAGCRTKIKAEISDNGQGFDAETLTGAGWGLKNMQSRGEQLGTSVHIHSRPGQGTTIRLTMEGNRG
jgi:signal transduction histidine kinase